MTRHDSAHLVHFADLPKGRPHAFSLSPDADALAALAYDLGILALRKVTFAGNILPLGRSDWRLEARLGATVVQPCVVTLKPVTTRLEETVTRTYLAGLPDPPGGAEVEMPEDDTAERLPSTLDLMAVLAEALALALPLYPRAGDAELGEAVFAAPGVAPMTDEDTRPFAGLRALRGGDGGDDG